MVEPCGAAPAGHRLAPAHRAHVSLIPVPTAAARPSSRKHTSQRKTPPLHKHLSHRKPADQQPQVLGQQGQLLSEARVGVRGSTRSHPHVPLGVWVQGAAVPSLSVSWPLCRRSHKLPSPHQQQGVPPPKCPAVQRARMQKPTSDIQVKGPWTLWGAWPGWQDPHPQHALEAQVPGTLFGGG